jgi:hypothetical protein
VWRLHCLWLAVRTAGMAQHPHVCLPGSQLQSQIPACSSCTNTMLRVASLRLGTPSVCCPSAAHRCFVYLVCSPLLPSSREAEYQAAPSCCAHMLWHASCCQSCPDVAGNRAPNAAAAQASLKESNHNQAPLTPRNLQSTARSKHIDVIHHLHESGLARKSSSRTAGRQDNLADCFTKSLSTAAKFRHPA